MIAASRAMILDFCVRRRYRRWPGLRSSSQDPGPGKRSHRRFSPRAEGQWFSAEYLREPGRRSKWGARPARPDMGGWPRCRYNILRMAVIFAALGTGVSSTRLSDSILLASPQEPPPSMVSRRRARIPLGLHTVRKYYLDWR